MQSQCIVHTVFVCTFLYLLLVSLEITCEKVENTSYVRSINPNLTYNLLKHAFVVIFHRFHLHSQQNHNYYHVHLSDDQNLCKKFLPSSTIHLTLVLDQIPTYFVLTSPPIFVFTFYQHHFKTKEHEQKAKTKTPRVTCCLV
jgi:hypothetical protein